MNRPIDLQFAQQILADLIGSEVTRVQISDICDAVVNRFKVKLSDMQSKKRTKRIAFPRQVCMFMARELTDTVDAFNQGLRVVEVTVAGRRMDLTLMGPEGKIKRIQGIGDIPVVTSSAIR